MKPVRATGGSFLPLQSRKCSKYETCASNWWFFFAVTIQEMFNYEPVQATGGSFLPLQSRKCLIMNLCKQLAVLFCRYNPGNVQNLKPV